MSKRYKIGLRMTLIVALLAIGLLTSASGLCGQAEITTLGEAGAVIGSWPASTMLGAVCVGCLVALWLVFKSYARAAEANATAVEHRTQTIDKLVLELHELRLQLMNRPCIIDRQ